ncbi:MAG: hypothetical protein D3920_13455, partial [Candidatus Electrothrix sp. AW2]|nr:hypothetical protein [Candidatus Electrothrix gigas]
NPLVRRYRDLIGRCNQVIAAFADQVFLVRSSVNSRKLPQRPSGRLPRFVVRPMQRQLLSTVKPIIKT